MDQDNFYRSIVQLICNQAIDHDPEQLANSLYFFMKQHPENVKVDKAWGDMLRNIKVLLTKHLCWEMIEVHRLFVKLSKLTKYMKKST